MFFGNGEKSGKRKPTSAELKELRVRARRRLVGALALVLAAVILVPWLFEEPVSEDSAQPVFVPAAPEGLSHPDEWVQDQGTLAQGESDRGSIQFPDVDSPETPEATQSPPATEGEDEGEAGATAPSPDEAATRPAESEPRDAPDDAPSEAPTERAPEPEAPARAAEEKRTDDGSVALALLEGRAPDASQERAAPARGNYYLQVAAYAARDDAQRRRDSLREAGVTDAYVEEGTSGGKTVYRLRVGPFGSREAAQAAQTRLRALGYPNGLIASK